MDISEDKLFNDSSVRYRVSVFPLIIHFFPCGTLPCECISIYNTLYFH